MTTFINTIQSLSNKDEEIKFLETIKDYMPKDRYLADLFTWEFITHVNMQIKNDFSADLYADYSVAELRCAEALQLLLKSQNQIRDAEAEASRLNAAVNLLKMTIDEHTATIEELREKNYKLELEREDFVEKLKMSSIDCEYFRDLLIAKKQEVADLNVAIESRDQTIAGLEKQYDQTKDEVLDIKRAINIIKQLLS